MGVVLGIIPARGGSKGIPQKNVTLLRGKPLIAHTIDAAKNSKGLSDFILSTDSQDIANVASKYGLVCAGLRPGGLSTDTARNIDAVVYEVGKYERNHRVTVDVVVLLQPTTPMRTCEDIDQALNAFTSSNAETLISVYEANSVHPSIMYYRDHSHLRPVLKEGSYLTRRQEFRNVYVRNGALYIATRSQVVDRKSFVSQGTAFYLMPRDRSVNIDEPYDLELADWMMGRYE